MLESAERLAVGEVAGPEAIAVDSSGILHSGTVDGRIVSIDDRAQGDYIVPGGKTVHSQQGIAVKTLAMTGGRPLGVAATPSGDLIVADAVKGLLSIAPGGQITTLPTDVGGKPVHFADDVTVASDGTIYFSDASDKFGIDAYVYDMLEARPHGRLLRYGDGRSS